MKDEHSLKEVSEEILREMTAWNASHPKATFLEIEVKARELVSKLEAHLIQESALERETDTCSQPEERERPTGPTCQVPLLWRGKRTRQLQGPAGRAIHLKRTYGTCPNCGTGFFPRDEQLRLQPGQLTPLQLQHLVHFGLDPEKWRK